MKKILTTVMITAFCLTSVPVYGQYGSDRGGTSFFGFKQLNEAPRRPVDLEADFWSRARALAKKKEELGLTEKQMNKIMALKTQVDNDLAGKEKRISEIDVEIRAKLREEPPDTGAIASLVDEKYELRKQEARVNLSAIDELNGMLTGEQREKLRLKTIVPQKVQTMK